MKQQSEADYQRFMRKATDEEKEDHKRLKKEGGTKAQAAFRTQWMALNITGATATASKETTEKQTHRTSRLYKNFWKMVEAEGGLMNRDFAISICTNIAEACEARGPPCVLWDPVGKCKRYLHGEEGVDDEFVTLRNLVVRGDVDLPQDVLAQALKAGENEGLCAIIPPDAPSGVDNIEAGNSHPPAQGVEAPTPAASGRPEAPEQKPNPFSDLMQQLSSSATAPQHKLLPLMMELYASASVEKPAEKDETDPDKDKKDKNEKDKKDKKVKTHGAQLFTECNFGGRKLEGMIRHAETIIKQSKDETNAWSWAKDESKRLEDAVSKVKDVSDKCQESVQTSTLHALEKKKGSPDAAKEFLILHKEALTDAATVISEPLSEIVAMHKAKINKQAKSV